MTLFFKKDIISSSDKKLLQTFIFKESIAILSLKLHQTLQCVTILCTKLQQNLKSIKKIFQTSSSISVLQLSRK